MNPLAFCDFGPGHLLVFGPEVGPLQYYSHLPIIAIAIGLAGFIYFANRKALPNKILFGTIITYAVWVFLDSVIWASNQSNVIMFAWSLQILMEPLVYIGSLYLLYVLNDQKDVPFWMKLIWAALYIPLAITAPTALNLNGFDVQNCLATEGFFGHYYSYGVEALFIVWIIVYSVHSFVVAKGREAKTKILSLSFGVILFLVAFSWGNIIGSYTEDWQLAQYGLFGMPIFTGFLVYSIVKYRTFNIRLIGSVALVIGLIASTFSLLFVDNVTVFRQVSIITFLLSIVFGYMLIRSVYHEVKQRERIEKLAGELEKANKQQVVLIHFITHQIKGFVTKSRNIFSMMLEGDFGPLPDTMKPMVEEGFRSDTQGATTIQEILNASNVKSGSVTYNMQPMDFGKLVEKVATNLRPNAEAKHLTFTVDIANEPLEIVGDTLQLENAVKNMIDNAIKYTKAGSVSINVIKDGAIMRFTEKDTGVGITPEDMARLFTEGGHGTDSVKVNVESTGFGLYIVKNIIDAHKGKVWAESEGAGKGSKFTIELPLSQAA